MMCGCEHMKILWYSFILIQERVGRTNKDGRKALHSPLVVGGLNTLIPSNDTGTVSIINSSCVFCIIMYV
jgi:hypothetical protein